jgi:hypothetical protein
LDNEVGTMYLTIEEKRMEKQEAIKELSVLKNEILKTIKAAEDFADEHKLSFHLSINDHSSTYHGAGTTPEYLPDWMSSNCYGEENTKPLEQGIWVSSSDLC